MRTITSTLPRCNGLPCQIVDLCARAETALCRRSGKGKPDAKLELQIYEVHEGLNGVEIECIIDWADRIVGLFGQVDRRIRFRESLERIIWGVEEVVGRVGRADFLADVRCVAAGRWRFATLVLRRWMVVARESRRAIVADDVDEKPWNGTASGEGA